MSCRKEWDRRYKASDKGKLSIQRYNQSDKRKVVALKSAKKRVKERRDYIAALKESRACADCQRFFPAVVMDYDHRRGEKIASISRLVGSTKAWDIIDTEISKCDLVCANCHRIRTAIDYSLITTKTVTVKVRGLRDRVDALKAAHPCTDCHKLYPACCMDYDHCLGPKSLGVAVLASRGRSWSVIEEEILKCELVCANCHRIRTRDRGTS